MTSTIEVAVEAPIPNPLSYGIGEHSSVHVGQSVRVPLGKRTVHGVVVRVDQPAAAGFALKNILEIESTRPHLTKDHLSWFDWIAKYYHYPIGEVIKLAFPPVKKKPAIEEIKALNTPKPPPVLTPEQLAVVNAIPINAEFKVHLIHGVTGSGKTEIYMQLLGKCVERGLQGLVLVPEISLTPQLVARFSERFPNQVAVIHSHLTNRQKTDAWWDMIDSRKSILIGARSALFCPVKKWGVIIIDEEHEASFKQEEKLKYHARDCAIMLANKSGFPIALGSATPSLESWHNATTGRYQLHSLKDRVNSRSLPEIRTIDLKAEKENTVANVLDLPSWLSVPLYDEIKSTLARKEQVALFLNRRGVSSQVICKLCGFVEECPNCSVALTLHGRQHLTCHYCDYEKFLALTCPSCKEGELSPLGLGTELVESDLATLFPLARLDRADRDEIKSRAELEQMISAMEKGETDILIGTQMIAKGLDFERLTLVGLVLADVGLYMPDFRSGEKSFQLITQVAGRSGRHSKTRGKVLIQTFNANHPSIQFALKHDYLGFVEHELKQRREFHFPPFNRISILRVLCKTESMAENCAAELATRAEQLARLAPAPIEVFGPSPAPLAKIRGQYRYQIMLKHSETKFMTSFHENLLSGFKPKASTVKIILDVEPISML